MKIFIDSADLEEIKEAFSWGIIDGLTTNPSLIKKAKEKYPHYQLEEYIKKILKAANNLPVSLEVDGREGEQITAEQMYKEAKNIFNKFKESNPSINIKIPINPAFSEEENNQFASLKVISKLKAEHIPVNATLIMSPEQALLAAKAGAEFVSPFMGRLDDKYGEGSGVQLVKDIKIIFEKYQLPTKIIAASIRTIEHLRESAKIGAEISTIPFKIIKKMISHPLTYAGLNKFKEDMVKEYSELINN